MVAIMTAAGPVESDKLGPTLMHEHIFGNMLIEFPFDGLLNDYNLMREEVGAFIASGGGTIVDLTSAEFTAGAAPDPTGVFSGHPATGYAEDGTRAVNNVLALQRLAAETGLNIVLGAGHYRDPYIDKGWFDRFGIDWAAERIVADLTEGLAGTSVRAAIIGEIGADRWHISATEERSFRAAARAQLRVGAAITTHAARWPVGISQLDLLTSEGVDPDRVIIGHCDTVNILDYHVEVARRGAFVQFDTIRGSTEYDTRLRVGFVMNLVKEGYIDQILLSHDVCRRTHLHISGGGGYDYIPTTFAPFLLDAGLQPEEVQHILVDNPRRALSGA